MSVTDTVTASAELHAEVRYEVAHHVATITLDAPERMNTISGPMLGSISRFLLQGDGDPDVRCVVLTGAGRAFCAGLDLAAQARTTNGGLGNLGTPSAGAGEFDLRDAPPVVLHNMDTPTVCALNGGAAGYGLDLALGCDLRIATASAKLNPGFAKRGILPESGGTWLLPRMVGYAKAAELAFRGNTLTAADAAELGIVNHAVPDDGFVGFVAQVAGEIAANAPLAVRAIKRMMRAAETETFDQHIHHVFLQLLPLLGTSDFREGVNAFLEKRSADFTGRWRRADVSLLEGLATTRAIRRYTGDPIPDADLAEILWYAQRAPSGTNRQKFRFITLRRHDPVAAPARELLASSFRTGWAAKRSELDRNGPPDDGSPRARMQAAMQHLVDHVDEVPVIVLVGLERYRPPHPTEGGSVYPACQNLLLAARALGYGGVLTGWHTPVERELRELVGVPEGVALHACITLGVPAGRHGPLRRKPLTAIVHDGVWGRSPDWLGEWGD